MQNKSTLGIKNNDSKRVVIFFMLFQVYIINVKYSKQYHSPTNGETTNEHFF